MGLSLFTVQHDLHGLATVERLSRRADRIAPALLTLPGVRGVVVVSTCNRLEAYVDAATGVNLDLMAHVVNHVVQDDGPTLTEAELPLAVFRQEEVLRHLFRVAAGLNSMVVGEREVAGQLRRALAAANEAGTTTYPLTASFERALRCSRKVAQLPELAATGRSIVALGLDLAQVRPTDSVLLIGTGSYAGATVSALRERGVEAIHVYSPSGRGPQFAAGHDCTAVPAGDLPYAARAADLIVSCRGGGQPVLTTSFVASLPRSSALTIVDLALSRDTEPGVADLPDVTLFDLETIQARVPALAREQLQTANELVEAAVVELEQLLTGRQMDPAVVALTDAVQQMVDDEIARLPQGRPLETADAAHALRRLAARMIHGPRVRAREAALDGRAHEFLAGLEALYGIEASLDADYVTSTPVDPVSLDSDRCPVTGMVLDDLRASVEEDAR